MAYLLVSGLVVLFAGGRHLLRCRTRLKSAVAAVVADLAVIVHNDGFVIDIVDIGDVDIIHRAVVSEDAAMPVAAFIAIARVAEAIVNAAVEADVRAPVSCMPHIEAAAPAPIAGRPQLANGRRTNPDAGHPVVAI